jgi:hypothetical protein
MELVRLQEYACTFKGRIHVKKDLDPHLRINQGILSSFSTSICPINRIVSNNSIKNFSKQNG